MVKGDIVLIPFPFTDLTGTKLRPALVLITTSLDITVCFITSRLNIQEPTDVLIKPSIGNGLKKLSILKTNKLATIEKSLVLGLLGSLTPTELSIVDQNLKTIFKLP